MKGSMETRTYMDCLTDPSVSPLEFLNENELHVRILEVHYPNPKP